MIVQMSHWEMIREHFSQEEKDALNAAITGETICPRGVTLDEQKIPEIVSKIKSLLKNTTFSSIYGSGKK